MVFQKTFENKHFLLGSQTISTRKWLRFNSREIFWNQPSLCANVFRFLTLKQWLTLRRLNTNCCAVVDHLISVQFHQECNKLQLSFSNVIPEKQSKFKPQTNKRFEIVTEEILQNYNIGNCNLKMDIKTRNYLLLKDLLNYVRCDVDHLITDEVMDYMRTQIRQSFHDLWLTPLNFLLNNENNNTSSNDSKKAYFLSRHLILKAMRHLFIMHEKPVKNVLLVLSSETKDNIHWKFIQSLSEETQNIYKLKNNKAKSRSESSGWLLIASYLTDLPDFFIKYCARTNVNSREPSWNTLKLLFHWIRALIDYHLLILQKLF
ncbi:uncharacterized protein LOC128884222 [Hylaeus volcanicus]|uniref:uncharacterized protein LOC128884222 n=1 Tax=Hylaeus volcanicus TaxID=313075 RepID=UPI0023B81B1C|nr:uncharacterized protein LOC128884222 [Hylaeus volcanicus]